MTPGRPRAAVAVLLRGLGTDDPRVLLGHRRMSGIDPWSGHLALPGGRREEGDRDFLDTALRECAEEAGIEIARARVLGALPDVVAGRVTGWTFPCGHGSCGRGPPTSLMAATGRWTAGSGSRCAISTIRPCASMWSLWTDYVFPACVGRTACCGA